MTFRIRALYARLDALHADHKRIAFGAVSVATFVAVGKIAGAARDVALAWRYGVGEVVDAFQLANTLVFWLPTTLVGVLSIILVPLLVRLRREDADKRRQFLKELYGSSIVVAVFLAIGATLCTPVLVPLLANKLPASSHEMLREFTLGLAPCTVLVLMSGVFSARLVARERQINTLLEGLTPAVVAIFIVFWPSSTTILPLLIGTLLGMSLQAAWLGKLARGADGDSAGLNYRHNSAWWPQLYKSMGVMTAGQLLMSCINPLDQFTAAQLGDGAIATLGYASRLVGLLLGLGALAVSRAALPVISDLASLGQSARAYDVSLRWASLLFGVGLATALIAWPVVPAAVSLLLERGAFGSEQTQAVAEVLRWELLQVPFYFSGLVLVQLLASEGRYRTIAFFAGTNLLVKFALNYWLSAQMGISGIALATGLMYAWSFGCLYWSSLSSKSRSIS